MIQQPEDILLDLVITTDGQAEEPYSYHNWGYTIYRTCYTPESQSQWESLIEATQLGVEKSLPGSQNDEPPTTSQLLRSLLRLDFRSDASLYDGLTMEQLRQTYLNPQEDSVPPPNFNRSERLFLVADAEVLMDPYFLPEENETPKVNDDNDTSDDATSQSVQKWQYQYHGYSKSSSTKRRWLKCVEVDYVAADHHPRRRGQDPRPYFGWFMVTAESVMELWEVLLDQDVEEIKPRLGEGIEALWEAERTMEGFLSHCSSLGFYAITVDIFRLLVVMEFIAGKNEERMYSAYGRLSNITTSTWVSVASLLHDM
ncbi:uncharacterized protein J4E84_005292 [Alternaria hordeiaustralica]|uniref:uncharacterized protein n=1 Tax=Alternaria hordeiaustralica TaxID=1187925 RepID=UPI0020C3E111|nr:uncharacterized protein J4E84_005292 [Alternaria hordeiaustralica]KAI4686921.1 hypothetical protein J4E84_005292 [Alternaria hordeiaustralica]